MAADGPGRHRFSGSQADVSNDRGETLAPRPTTSRPDPAGSIVADGVGYARNGRVILDDVRVVAAPGQALAVVGPSGSGKSSLLALLAGLEQPDVGTIRRNTNGHSAAVNGHGPAVSGHSPAVNGHSAAVNGHSPAVNGHSPAVNGQSPAANGHSAAANGHSPAVNGHNAAVTGLVLQGYGLVSVLTAAENVEVPLQAGAVGALDRSTIRIRAARALESVGLTAVADHLVDELSGGQQQRVAIARALALAPTVLFADELTAELDHEWKHRVLELMFAISDAGGIVVLATHDMEIAARCDRVVHLEDGRISAP